MVRRILLGGSASDTPLPKLARPLLAFLLAALAVGCSTTEHGDLQRYIEQVKARKAGRIAPVPTFKTYESFAYSASDLRDPFERDEETALLEGAGTGPTPDLDRHKEALEAFPLDELKFVGHLERDGQTWAIITDPSRLVHRVQVGNYIGKNYGQIVAISETSIEIKELVPSGRGWVERMAALALVE